MSFSASYAILVAQQESETYRNLYHIPYISIINTYRYFEIHIHPA